MDNLNQYNESLFRPLFESTEVYKKILIDYKEENLVWEKFFLASPIIKRIADTSVSTPRHAYENYFSMSVFYYLLPLLEKDYDNIYDIGCGKNMFKPYIPRLLGVGAEDAGLVRWYDKVKDESWPIISSRDDFKRLPIKIQEECINVHGLSLPTEQFYGDIHGFVDDYYIKTHKDYYQSVFSICALHFRPIDQFAKIVKDFVSMIESGGRGFLSLNLQRMLDMTPRTSMTHLFGESIDNVTLEKYIRNEIKGIVGLRWLIVDIDLTLLDEGVDGNIRLVFEKQHG